MIDQRVEIVNRLGLHARAAVKLVKIASQFPCSVTLANDKGEVDGKSILGIMLMEAAQGTWLTVACSGADEKEALTQIVSLISDRFGEGE